MGGGKLTCRASICVAMCALVATCMTAAPALAARSADGRREPAIRLKLIGTSYSRVYTDGVRWAVYEPTEGVTRIMDTVRGTSTTRPDPEGCAGGLVAVGGGEMLYDCSDPECPEAADVCLLMKAEIVCPPVAAGTTCHTVMVPTGTRRAGGLWRTLPLVLGTCSMLARGFPRSSSATWKMKANCRRSEASGRGRGHTSSTGTLGNSSTKIESLCRQTMITRTWTVKRSWCHCVPRLYAVSNPQGLGSKTSATSQ